MKHFPPYVHPEEDYRVKKFHIGDRVQIKHTRMIPKCVQGACGKVVFINQSPASPIRVILEGRWLSHGMETDQAFLFCSEEDLMMAKYTP